MSSRVFMKSMSICLSASLRYVLRGSGRLVRGCPGSAIDSIVWWVMAWEV